MTALGKEVTQRAEACAEARKLHAALRRQIEVARRGRARNLDTVDLACRRLTTEATGEARASDPGCREEAAGINVFYFRGSRLEMASVLARLNSPPLFVCLFVCFLCALFVF